MKRITAFGLSLFVAAHSSWGQMAPGTVDPSFNAGSSLTQPVYASAVLEDGKVLITGEFRAVNGALAPGVARLLTNGLTDVAFTTTAALNWGKTATNVVEWGLLPHGRAIAVQPDGRILVGGYFVNPDTLWIWEPTWESIVIRLNPDGSCDDTFSIPITGMVFSMAVQNDGKVLMAGDFAMNGRRGIVRLNADGSLDESFLYALPGADNTVRSVALLDSGKILIGGNFTKVNGTARSGVARLNADGSLDSGFVANVTAVNAMAAQPDGKVVIGGNFTVVNGASRNRLARLNVDGSLDTSFLSGMAGADNEVYCLNIQSGGTIVVGGYFSSINGRSQRYLAKLTANGAVDSSFTLSLNNTVTGITAQPDGQMIVCGAFSSVGGIPQNRVARVRTDGTLDSTFGNGPAIFTGPVSCVVTQADGKLLANSVAGTRIGRFQTNGAPDTSFLTGLEGANGAVKAIAVTASGKILAAGQFSSFNGYLLRGIVRLDAGGSVDFGFQNGMGATSGSVNCLQLQPDGRILIGGLFSDIKGAPRGNIARLNADGSLDASFLSNQSGVNGEVLSLALQSDGKILVGGNFSDINGEPRWNLARLNPDGSVDRTFQEGMNGVDGPIYALAVQPDHKTLVGGRFSMVNDFVTWDVGRVLPDGSADTNFFADTYTDTLGIRALALQSDGTILIAGDITQVASDYFNSIARLRTNGSPEAFLLSPNGALGAVTALTLLDDTRLIAGGEFDVFNGTNRSYLARLAYGRAGSSPLDEALNSTGLTWTNEGTASWFGQSLVAHDGVAAAQSGSIADGQSSTLSTTVTGPGCLSFWWKVSSESGYDYLTFTCTGSGMATEFRISGERDWQQQLVCVPTGTYKVTWTYSKDSCCNAAGMDAGWVDEVAFTSGNLAPTITRDPADRTNSAGASVSFTAAGTGIAPLSYQWLFNGSEIANATNSFCVIAAVVPEQAGIYTLRLSNPYGSAFSAGARLTVIPIRAAGANDYGQAVVETNITDAIAIAAGQFHNLLLKHDGTIYAWGNNGFGQCAVPPTLGPATGIAAGGYHSLAVMADGTVTAWGDNAFGQSSPPAGLSNVLSVAAGMWHSLALRQNGTIAAWGDNSQAQSTVPIGLSNIIAIAAGGTHSLVLRADGRVFGWGGNLGPSGSFAGQASVPWGLNNVVAIGAGGYHSVAVKNDGSIVGWGDNSFGQLSLPTNLPPAVAIAAGGAHTVAVLGDGTAAAWGANFDGQCNISRSLTNVVTAAAGEAHTLLLFGQRPPPPQVQVPSRAGNVFSIGVPTFAGKFYALEYKPALAATNWISLPTVRGTGHVIQLTDPTASAVQRYYRVRQW